MRWCRFRHNRKTAFGIIDDADTITVIGGSPFENYTVTGETHALADVKLLAPAVPPTFYAAGVNYREHVTFAAQVRGEEPVFPAKPDVGYRAVNALVAHEDAIVIPHGTLRRRCSTRANWWRSSAGSAGTCPRTRRWTTCSATPSATT